MLVMGMRFFCFAQDKQQTVNKSDTAKIRSDSSRTQHIIQNIKRNKKFKQVLKSITKKQQTNPTATIKSEDFFMAYKGKIIRRILIKQVGFEKSVTDTSKHFKTTITRIANKLHSDTRERVIRDNLFIHTNRPVNPFKMADNERYLRDLDFILDAKFFIVPLKHTSDSVDVIVRTRDIFSIGGSISPRGPTKTSFKLFDANLFGFGQRLQFNGLVETSRSPVFGYEMLYKKNSMGGSFITFTGGYTQLNTGSSYGTENEKAFYVKLDRPLVSPYTRFAGGMEISRNWSQNFYGVRDNEFRHYRYLVHDFWGGYNITAQAGDNDRNRHFFAVRLFDQHFTRPPSQYPELQNPIYSNRSFLLGAFTFFKQNFYTARYIYGFGRTEDIPYGHTMSLIFGWARHMNLQRPYIGVDVGKSVVSRKGQFYNLTFRAGAFNNNGFEDAVVLLSGSMTSRLISYNKLLMRQTIVTDITKVFNQRTTLPLDINNDFGLRGFSADSLWGSKRFHINSETVIFTPLQLLGFKLAPFFFGEMAFLTQNNQPLFSKEPYFGIGGGMRIRNENLVFGTIELRTIYYPRTFGGSGSFNIGVTSRLRVKYSASFVKPPAFVLYN